MKYFGDNNMNKFKKILLIAIIAACVAVTALGCTSTDKIDYSKIESITVDEASIADGFTVSDFDISKVILNVKYLDTVDELGSTVTGETVQMPATLSMVKAEDKAKLSVAGTHSITLIYRKYTINFQLTLRDSQAGTYKVVFLDSDGNRLGDPQNVAHGGRAVQPALPTKEGYSFVGWRDRDTGSMSTFDNVQKDLTLEAVYAANAYKVGYYTKINGEEELIVETNVPRGGNAYDYVPEIPVKQGYSNGRWENIDAMKNVNSEGLKFYAIYDVDQVQATFRYMRFGTAYSSHNVSYDVGSEIKNPPEPSRDGYKFVEWRVNGKKIDFPYTIHTEVTFEAIYISINEGNKGLKYAETVDGVEVIGFDGEETVVVIPKEVSFNGEIKEVVGIRDGAFAGKNIKEFAVGDDNERFVTEDNVLYGKDKTVLYAYPAGKADESFALLGSVTEVRPYAFHGAKNLTLIKLNDNLVDIGDYAFAECKNLTEIDITKSVVSIGEGAFAVTSSDGKLSRIGFDDAFALTEIKDKAFYGAAGVGGLALPSSLTSLGSSVFYGCKSLRGVTALNNGHFTVYEGALYDAALTTLYLYPALYGADAAAGYGSTFSPQISLPQSCNRIKSGAFGYVRINSVVISGENTVMEEKAFDCPTLRKVFIDAESVTISRGTFGDFVSEDFGPEIIANAAKLSNDCRVALESIFRDKLKVCDKNTWTQIRDFENDFIYEVYSYTETADNGSSVSKDGIRILGSRQVTEDLYIPSTLGNVSVTAIADYAFYGDDFATKIYLPSDLKEIGVRAFSNMANVTDVTVNDTLTSVGDYAFADCPSLNFVRGGANMTDVKYFGKAVFENTPFIKRTDVEFLTVGCVLVKFTGFTAEVTIPENVEFIAADAFVNHGEITSISFAGNKIKTVDGKAFQFCDGIREIKFPSSIRKVASKAFNSCKKLALVSFSTIKDDAGLNVAADAFDDEVKVVYNDTELFTLTYRIDATDSFQSRGVVIVNAHKVDNTSRLRFAGWFNDEEFASPAEFPMKLTGDKTVYAKWIGVSASSTGIVYRLTEDGTYAVTGYEGSDKYVIIPDTYMGKAVQIIDDGAFRNNKNIINVELPRTRNFDGSWSSNLIKIGEDAFEGTAWYDNYNGDFVIIDDFLIKYKGKSSVISIPDNVKKIAKGAFKDNDYIVKAVLPDTVTELDDDVFYGCTKLKTVVLSENLLSIGYKAFKGCTVLSEVNFEVCENLSSIAYDAFDGTLWLGSHVDPCVVINGILYKYNGNAASTSLHIYNGIISIGERAFADNTALRRVYIPQSVTNIGESAFENSYVEEVVLYAGGSGVTYIQDRAFYNAKFLYQIDLTLARNLVYIGEYAFAECSMLKSIEIPSETTTLSAHAFENSGLNKVTFAKGSKLTSVSAYAFSGCSSLFEVSFGGNSALVSIGEYAFYNCSSLSYFNNSGGVLESIGDYGFYGCSSLVKFYVNENTLSSIGDNALKDVGYTTGEDGFVVLGNILIGYEGYDTYITIPDNVTTIYNAAFEGNSRIKKVTFGENSSIRNVNSRAFFGCTGLSEINFPSSINFVGDDVMTGTQWYNDKVRNGEEFIIISNTLVKYNGTTAKRVHIPDEVQVINKGAFDGSAVFDVAIGSNVLSIEDGAFANVDNATFPEWTITILNATPPVMKERSKLTAKNIIIPSEDLRDIYRLDEGWYVQYDLVKVIAEYKVTYIIKEEEGEPIAEESLYALYEEKQVSTKTYEDRSYIFVGWYFDEGLTDAVTYPYILTDDITLYAKCIDNSVGSNGDSFQTATSGDGKVIELYVGEKDNKIVVIQSQGGGEITAIGSGWIRDEINGTHSRNGEEYVEDKVNGKYRRAGAFEGHTELTEVYFATGSNVSVIGKDAFKGCINLEKIVFPASVKTIESGAFENCTSLKEIVFTGDCDGLSLAEGAFKGCSSLEKISLPSGLKKLGNKAFEGCVKLKDIFVKGEIAVSIGRDDRPFEIIEGMRIHIKASSMSSYSATWEAYAAYLVGEETI